jgi:hypothetical protein
MLDREEYIEQAYLFRTLGERLPRNMPLQELLRQVGEELLASAKLPMAVDFLRSELEHTGSFSPAMAKLSHYFTPFQTYVVHEAEDDRGRFDMRVAVEVLRAEAAYRAEKASRAGIFLFQFETICRNRLRYDQGLHAIAHDLVFDSAWRDWILTVRRQIGIVDFADLLYVRSEDYRQRRKRLHGDDGAGEATVLFGEKEGKIALANRGKDPLYLFAALQRHLGYPTVPRPKPSDQSAELIPQLMRRMERLEARIKLLEDEQKEGIDITKFYGAAPPPPGMAEGE